MRELNVNEIEAVNGGGIGMALVGSFLLRRYGGQIAAGTVGFVAGWLSE